MTIFESLREDHEVQRSLFRSVIRTSGDTPKRKDIFKKLKKELQIHAGAEERHFYIPLIEEDLTQEKARHSVAEHHEIDELIEELEETEFSSSAWLKICRALKKLVFHHLDEEEHEVFQMAGKALTEKQKIHLSVVYRKQMKESREKE